MATTSLNYRAIKELRALGYFADKVEQRLPIPGRHVTRDLFGCIDIVALAGSVMTMGAPILAVQVTSASNVASRAKKSLAVARLWVKSGGAFEIWGYDGKRKRRLVMRKETQAWHEETMIR